MSAVLPRELPRRKPRPTRAEGRDTAGTWPGSTASARRPVAYRPRFRPSFASNANKRHDPLQGRRLIERDARFRRGWDGRRTTRVEIVRGTQKLDATADGGSFDSSLVCVSPKLSRRPPGRRGAQRYSAVRIGGSYNSAADKERPPGPATPDGLCRKPGLTPGGTLTSRGGDSDRASGIYSVLICGLL